MAQGLRIVEEEERLKEERRRTLGLEGETDSESETDVEENHVNNVEEVSNFR